MESDSSFHRAKLAQGDKGAIRVSKKMRPVIFPTLPFSVPLIDLRAGWNEKLTARPPRSGSGTFGLGRDLQTQHFHPLLGVYELFGSQLLSQQVAALGCV